jgi:hypothetical protein
MLPIIFFKDICPKLNYVDILYLHDLSAQYKLLGEQQVVG